MTLIVYVEVENYDEMQEVWGILMSAGYKPKTDECLTGYSLTDEE